MPQQATQESTPAKDISTNSNKNSNKKKSNNNNNNNNNKNNNKNEKDSSSSNSGTNYVTNRVKAKKPTENDVSKELTEDDAMVDDEVNILNDDNSLLDSSNLQTPKSLKHKAAYVTNDKSFKQLIIEAYKELFNADLDTSLDENELYDQLVSASSELFEDEADLETRFKYLQKRFSAILHTKKAPFQNMPPFKTEGYKLVFDKVNTIKNVVDSIMFLTEN